MNIYKNTWAGYDYYFVHTHSNGFGVRGYSMHNAYGKWKVNKAWFSNETIKDAEHFPKVGEIDLNKIIIENVLKEVGDGRFDKPGSRKRVDR